MAPTFSYRFALIALVLLATPGCSSMAIHDAYLKDHLEPAILIKHDAIMGCYTTNIAEPAKGSRPPGDVVLNFVLYPVETKTEVRDAHVSKNDFQNENLGTCLIVEMKKLALPVIDNHKDLDMEYTFRFSETREEN